MRTLIISLNIKKDNSKKYDEVSEDPAGGMG